ncbi:MAG: Bcr/CflA family multidrug efflux MFS transporter [Pseudomonadota bacterium]
MPAAQRTPMLVFLLGSLTAFAPMSIDMYLPALPTMQREFATDGSQMQLTLAAFFAAFALGQLFYGPLADRFGRKPPLYASLSLFILASLGCALATSVEALIALRFLQAFGACAGVVIARAIVRDSFDSAEAARMYAAMMLVMGVAPMVAPILGGQLLHYFGWHSIFLALVAYGSLCLWAMHHNLPETLDVANRQPLVISRILRAYGNLLKHHRFRGFALTSSISMAGLYAFIAVSPFVFIEHFKVAPAHFGWIFGGNAFWLILASQFNGRLVRRFQPLPLLKASLLVQMLAGAMLLLVGWTGIGGLWLLLPPLFLYTGCLGFILPNATILAMEPYKAQAGTASALYGTIGSLSGAIAASAVSAMQGQDARTLCTVMALCTCLACLRSRFLRA